MSFYREGKKCNYYEVTEILNTLVNKEILTNLEEKEINGLFIRVMDFTQAIITGYLQKLDCRVTDLRQAFLILEQLKMITNNEVWEQAIQFSEAIEEGEKQQSELVKFMSTHLLGAMQELNTNINKMV